MRKERSPTHIRTLKSEKKNTLNPKQTAGKIYKKRRHITIESKDKSIL